MKPAVILTASTALLCGCSAMRSTPIDEPSALEGLQRVEVKGIDAVYRKSNADLSQYNRVIVRPVEVSFSKDWERTQSSALHTMARPDRDKIKSELAEAFAEVAKRELETRGGYQLVTEPGPDVLEVQARIINLYITAPDLSAQAAGRVRTYTTDAGEMTLVAELHDSVSGELLSRAYDRQDAADSGRWQWTNSVTNSAEARRIIATWATSLRNALDASRGKT